MWGSPRFAALRVLPYEKYEHYRLYGKVPYRWVYEYLQVLYCSTRRASIEKCFTKAPGIISELAVQAATCPNKWPQLQIPT